MSNPNINLNNLDSRYTKTADVAAAIAAQATTDAGQYAKKATGSPSDKQLTRYQASSSSFVYKSLSYIDAGDFFKDAGLSGNQDVTVPLQAAINAAIAANVELVIPSPGTGNYWYLSSTINIQPVNGSSSTNLSIRCVGPFYSFLWNGANGNSTTMQPVFQTFGWKRASVRDMQVRIPASANYVVAFDIDVTTAFPSSGFLNWENCHVSCAGTSGSPTTNCIGWRLGHAGTTNATGSEESYMYFNNCSVQWASGSGGAGNCIGWANEHGNGLNHTWVSCAAVMCNTAITNLSTNGAGDATGGGALYFYGFGTTTCDLVWKFGRAAQYGIYGGRHEVGGALLQVLGNVAGDINQNITMTGLLCAGMQGSGGALVTIGSAAMNLTVSGSEFQPVNGTQYGAAMFTLNAGTGFTGHLTVEQCIIGGTEPFYNVTGGTWRVSSRDNIRMSVNGVNGATAGSHWIADFTQVVIADNLSRRRRQTGLVTPDSPGAYAAALTLVANRAYIGRFVASEDMVVTMIAFAVTSTTAVSTDTVDVGLYDSSFNKIASTGAIINKLTSAGVKTSTFSSSVTLRAGLVYYSAISASVATATISSMFFNSAVVTQLFSGSATTAGVVEAGLMDSAHPLPATFVPAAGGSSSAAMLAVRES